MVRKCFEVPEIGVAERIEIPAKRAAVVVVDMQNDFVNPRGKLFVPTAPETVPRIRRLVDRARAAGALVVYTKDTHYPGDPEFSTWGEHAVRGTWGWEIVDELRPREGDIVIEKTRYDAFYGTPLDDLLRVYRRDHLVVVGTVANICVLHTVAGAALRWYRVYVPMDGVSALNEFDMYVAARQITFLYRGTLVKSVDGVVFT
ncbi:MAG: cysteine hydrolase [Thermoprotei archaeon]|nr:MAG: cysteine hydrolase [Thermoprotei archaeon]